MHRRTRSIPISAESFNRYLKPDALARIRDSRIIARSHRVHTVPSFHRPLSSSTLVPASPSAICHQSTNRRISLLSGRMYGPRFPQRKKLIAARSLCYLQITSLQICWSVQSA
ncbi:unnamed protein product [Rhodiola kirilowii]